jgi:hypothetical protein
MGGAGTDPQSRNLRMLVVLRAINMDRITEGFLRCALARGHTVQVALEQSKDRAGRAEGEGSLFDVLAAEYDSFSYKRLNPREDPWLYPATRLRFAIDYLRYLEPEFAQAENLRDRARSKAPWYVRVPAALGLLRIKPFRRIANSFLKAIEQRMPVSEQSLHMLRKASPDVLVVSPLVELGSPQADHLRAADALGIPTVLLVASWDNLTTKGVLRDHPDLTIVWNEDQVREAVELHELREETVVASGAHSHDHWFSFEPTDERAGFATKVGLDPDRRFVLYVCSSGFIAGDDEPEFVREWIRRLAESDDPELASLGVLIRPHPQNFGSWSEAELDEPGRVTVWPRGGVAPTGVQSKRDYFDSLHHAVAVVGINTTALVDSAIVRRPVFTMISDHFRSTQTGTLHFSYLARDEENGVLNVARSWDEHFDQLRSALLPENGHRERIEGFLESFVRPQGLERPAAPLAIGAVEEVTETEKEAAGTGGIGRALVRVAATGLGHVHGVRERARATIRRRVRTWQRKRRKRQAQAERARHKQARAQKKQARQSAKPLKEAGAKKQKKQKKARPAAEPGEAQTRERETVASGDSDPQG